MTTSGCDRATTRAPASESTFNDELGSGRQVTVTCSGLDGKPELVYVLQLYDQRPYGTVQVQVRNTTGKEVTVQAIRSVDAIGEPILNLGGPSIGEPGPLRQFQRRLAGPVALRSRERTRRDASWCREPTHLQPGKQAELISWRPHLRPVPDPAASEC